jgi:ABC-type uncharacterized transport system involved in gliding motility auxiliary subunit
VLELLKEYVRLANGDLTLETFDPRPFSDEEEQALAFGIQKFPISDSENFFFGLAAVSEYGKEAAITFFEPERQEFVEYDISRLLVRLSQRDKRTVGVLSSLEVMGTDTSPYMMQMLQIQGRQPTGPWTIITQLREQYEVVPVATNADSIEANIDFLVVVHPKNLGQRTLYAIDQFVMRGGKLVVFQDPFCIADQPMQDPQNPLAGMNYDSSSNLNALLEKWGVTMDPAIIAADPKLAISAQTRRDLPPSPIVTFLQITADQVNGQEVITGKLHDLKYIFGGVLRKVEGVKTELTALIHTSAQGGTWKPASPFELRMPDAQSMLRGMQPSVTGEILAVRMGGVLPSAFPEGAPAVAAEDEDDDEYYDEEEPEGPFAQEAAPAADGHLKQSSPEASVIVVADVDLITDSFAYQRSFFGVAQANDNSTLLLNAIDFLGGSGDLIAIRSRGRFSRPFEMVDAIEKEAEKATSAEVEAINGRIQQFQARLNELGNAATDENVKLVESTAMAEREQVQSEIRAAQKELRRLNAGKRERIESLGLILQAVNMVAAPAAVLMLAITLAILKHRRIRQYTQKRAQE